jgi:hypothetical protein
LGEQELNLAKEGTFKDAALGTEFGIGGLNRGK